MNNKPCMFHGAWCRNAFIKRYNCIIAYRKGQVHDVVVSVWFESQEGFWCKCAKKKKSFLDQSRSRRMHVELWIWFYIVRCSFPGVCGLLWLHQAKAYNVCHFHFTSCGWNAILLFLHCFSFYFFFSNINLEIQDISDVQHHIHRV